MHAVGDGRCHCLGFDVLEWKAHTLSDGQYDKMVWAWMNMGSDTRGNGFHHGFGTGKLVAALPDGLKNQHLTKSHDLRISELESRRCAVSPRKMPTLAQNRLLYKCFAPVSDFHTPNVQQAASVRPRPTTTPLENFCNE